MHNQGNTSYPHEFPMMVKTTSRPSEIWPKSVNRAQASILDHVITNRDDIPPIGRSFSVDNEAEWREYCESEGEKKNYSGWYQFEQR